MNSSRRMAGSVARGAPAVRRPARRRTEVSLMTEAAAPSTSRRSPVHRLACRNEIGVDLPWSALLQHAIDTRGRDGQPAVLVALDESLLAEVPDMERHQRLGAAESALELHDSDPGIRGIVTPRYIQQREDGGADARVGGNLAVRRLLIEDPPLRRLHLLVREIIPCALLRIAEHTIRLDDPTERVGVTAVPIVRVVAFREVAKHALDGFPIGPWRHLEVLVVVRKLSCHLRQCTR